MRIVSPPLLVWIALALMTGCQDQASSPATDPGSGSSSEKSATAENSGGTGTAEAAVDGLPTDEAKAFYALGAQLAQRVTVFSMSGDELNYMIQGVRDAATGTELKVDPNEYRAKLGEISRERAGKLAAKEKEKGAEYQTKAAQEKGAVKTESGMIYVPITEGTGAQPKPTDKVKVHYKGTLISGEEFDSSYSRNQPASFGLNRVIKCWTEGVGMMKVGGKSKLVCPSDIAYGDRGRPPKIPGGATLVFEVELLEIE